MKNRVGYIDYQVRDQVMKAARVDESRRAVYAMMSTGTVDLYNEIIDPKAFTELLPKFQENPVLLADHDPTKQIGHWEDVKVTASGLAGWAVFASTPLADERWQLYRDGHAKAFSVGFIAIESEPRTVSIDGQMQSIRTFVKVRLLECSSVSIPANPDALVIAASLAGVDRQTSRATTDNAGDAALEARIAKILDRQLDAGPGGRLCTLIQDIAEALQGRSGLPGEPDYFGECPDEEETPAFSSASQGDPDLKALLREALDMASTVIQMFKDITRAAIESARAVAEVGKSLRGLSANIGGARAKEVFTDLTDIARENRFDVQGRAALIDSVTALTDAKPGLSNQAIVASAKNMAMLQRATGVSGRENAQLLIAMQERFGLGEAAAVDAATTAINSGMTAQAIRDMAERGGPTGGLQMLGLALGAREHGLDLNRASEGIGTLVGSLNRRDAEGNLAAELSGFGVTEGMSDVEKLQTLLAARDAGAMTRGQFETAIGGAQQWRVVQPMEAALRSGAYRRGMRSIMDSQAAENAIREITANPYVQAQERANLRELRGQVMREQSSLTSYGEAAAEREIDTRDLPTPLRQGAEFAGWVQDAMSPQTPEEMSQAGDRQIRNSIGRGEGNVTIIYKQENVQHKYDNANPPASGRPER